MKLKNNTYDILKWFVIIFLPATITLVASVGQIMNIENISVIVAIMTAVETFLGSLIGISTHNYNKEDIDG